MSDDQITVHTKTETKTGWVFSVTVGERAYTVTCTAEYWRMLTKKRIAPEELIRHSFVFLLAREPKEAILQEFDLPVIAEYFPEYKSTIQEASIQ